jgi:SAM-dependent methyltransferase
LNEAVLDPLEEVRRSRLLINRLDAWLFDEIQPYLGRRVMEVGSGHGNFTQHLLDRDLVVATDIEPSSIEVIREKFADYPNVRTRVHNICDEVDDQLRAFDIDTILSVNALEHIEDDRTAISNIAKILRVGGCAILIVPSHQWLYGTMDSSIGHFRRYTKRDMAQKMEAAGLVVEKQFYLNVLGVLGWFVNGRVLKQTVPPNGQLKLFNKVVPVFSWLERTVRPPFGLSLVSFARREAAGRATER